MSSPNHLSVKKIPTGYRIEKGGKRQSFSFEQAFELGHRLFNESHFAPAEQIFSALSREPAKGARAKIMLARCEAELSKYSDCEKLLQATFGENEQDVADSLQSAMVYQSFGMNHDAIHELVNLVVHHPELPTPCLYLGDLFFQVKKLNRATYCWKLAILRDDKGGAVAQVAKRQLKKLKALSDQIQTASEHKQFKSTLVE